MRLLALAGAALLVVGVGGCAASADEPAEPDSPGQVATTEPDASAEDTSVCGGLTTEDLAGLFGAGLTGPEPSTGTSNQNGATWTSTGCDWEGEGELEIDLDISDGSDFPGGSVQCTEPSGVGEVTVVEGIGDQAWWKFDDFNEVEGELRVCTDDRMIELAVDAESGSMSSGELLEKVRSAVLIVTG